MTIKDLVTGKKMILFSFLSISMIVGSIIAAEISGTSTAAGALTNSREPSGSHIATFASCDFDQICVDPTWRAPLELRLREPRFSSDPGRPIRWSAVESRIRDVLAKHRDLRIGLYVKDVKSGKTFEFNANTRFASASLVKVPLAVGLYKDMANKRVDPTFGPVFETRHLIGGSGVLKNEVPGKRVNLRDLSYLMLSQSDNTATNIITDLVGQDRVTQLCREMGWPKTNMVRPVMALELRKIGIENWTTPREMGRMFEGLYQGSIVSPAASREIMSLMLNTYVDDRIQRWLPPGIDVVHKTGLIHDNAHDVGIIFLPNNQAVVIAAMVDGIGTNYMAAKRPIAQIARILYEEATLPSAHKPPRRS